jgi:uncharacterized protein YegL
MNCVFCKRDVLTREHHIVPRCKGGKETVSACETCEDFIHSTWTHNELRDIYNNVETIVNNEKFKKFLKWLSKQSTDTVFKSSISKNRSRKTKYS